MFDYQVTRFEKDVNVIFFADFLQTQVKIMKDFLNGKSQQLPTTLSCLGSRILIMNDNFVKTTGGILADMKKKC